MENNKLVQKLVNILDGIIGKKLSNINKVKFGIDLYWLIIGKKLSLLIDHYYLSEEELSKLIKKLKLLNPNLIGVSLNENFNFLIMRGYFEELRDFNGLWAVDCSSKLKESELITEGSIILSQFKHEFLKLNSNYETSKNLILPIDEINQNFIISITGYLLNYPVVYFNNIEEGSSYLDNCLGGSDLCVYKFIAKIGTLEYLITSFSIPSALETNYLSHVIDQWKFKVKNFKFNNELDEGKNIEFSVTNEFVKLDKVCL